jgi:hypothetical protein
MSAEIRPFRPRIVLRIGRDGSLDFAASTDVEIVIVREGCREFLAHPNVGVGIGHVRRLLETAAGLRLPSAWPRAARGAA